jgi:hypothetical protein
MTEMTGASSPRKSYWRLSSDFLLEDEGYGADLFHTYCKVGERACATTIDHESLINVVGIDMVEKLQLSTTPHPRPYSLRRCHDKLDITHQTMVLFSIGKFSCDVLCDVIPVPLVSCHLLLGELWYKKNGATYDQCANTYTIMQDKIYVLRPMDKKPFRTWRKERLHKKKETAAAAIFETSVQSVGNIVDEIELKPRTVSFEEREDDTALPAPTTPIIALYSDIVKMKGMDELHSSCAEQLFQTWRLSYSMFGDGSVGPYACVRDIEAVTYFYLFGHRRLPKLSTAMHAFSGFLFLFLPHKEKINLKISCVRDLLSLKASGWGPPHDQINTVNQLERFRIICFPFIVTNSY